jgi:hypothetical protein
MCFAKRPGTVNVSGNDGSSKPRNAERRPNDHAHLVELPRHQAPVVPPVEQTLAATLGDAFELRGEAAEVVHPHALMVACTSASSTLRDDAAAARDADDGDAKAMQGGEE